MPLVRTRGISLPNGMEESLTKNNSYLLRQFNIKVFYCAYFYKFTIKFCREEKSSILVTLTTPGAAVTQV